MDSHSSLKEEVSQLSAKVLDLENRSWQNNISLRDILKTVTSDLLYTFLTDLMAQVFPNCTQLDLTIDYIHRIPKPKNVMYIPTLQEIL